LKRDEERDPLVTLVAALAGVLLALQAAYYLLYSYTMVTFPYQLDYGEGPILQIAVRVSRGELMYPTTLAGYPYVIASYMPVYYALSTLAVWATGPSFLGGRLIAALGGLVMALCGAQYVWDKTRNRFAAFLAAGFVLAVPIIIVWSNLMRVDVPAHALSIAGFVLVERGWRVPGIGALGLGVLTRRTNVGAIIGSLVGLLTKHGWPAALMAGIALAALIAVLVFAANLWSEGGMFQQLSWHTRSSLGEAWTWEQVWLILSVALRQWPVYFALAVAGAVMCAARPQHRGVLAYFLVTCGLFLTVGRIGSSFNYLVEPLAVGGMLVGVLWAEVAKLGPKWRPALMLVAGALAIQLVWTGRDMNYNISLLRPEANPSSSRAVVELIEEAPGPVLCEDVGLILLAGRGIPIEPFEFTQMAAGGVLDPEPVYRDVEEGRFPLIVLRFNPEDIPGHEPGEDWVCGRWPDGIIAPLMEHYRLADTMQPYFLYVPKRPPGEGGGRAKQTQSEP
jgi:hypothetical protein